MAEVDEEGFVFNVDSPGQAQAHLAEFNGDPAQVFNVPNSSNNIIFFSTGYEIIIRAGTVEKLVEMMTHPDFRDKNYDFAFLATAPTFVSLEDLIRLLGLRFRAVAPVGMAPSDAQMFDRTTGQRIRERVVTVFTYWLEEFGIDFAIKPELGTQLRTLLSSDAFEMYPWAIAKINEALDKIKSTDLIVPAPSGKESKTKKSGRPKDFTAQNFARALTAVEQYLYTAIQPREFLDLAWNSKNKEQLAPNLLAMIRNSTHVSHLVAGEVISESKIKKRAALVQMFIEAAKICHASENYNAVVEIVAGLSLPAVHRLSKTWNQIPEKTKATFEELLALTTEKNYAGIRNSMENSPSCIPYLGVYLTDLTFVTEGNPKMLSSTVQLTLMTGGKNKELIEFDGRMHCELVFNKMMEFVDEETRGNAANLMLFVAPKKGQGMGQYLENSKRLYEYEIYKKDRVSLVKKTRPLKYHVTGGLLGTTLVEQSWKVGKILEIISSRFGMPDGLFVMEYNGRVLLTEKTLWEQEVEVDGCVEIRGAALTPEQLMEYQDNGRLIEILFTEHSHMVITGATPVTDDTAYFLALLHLQSLYGSGLVASPDGKSVVKIPSVDDLGEKPLSAIEIAPWKENRVSEVDWQLRQLGIVPSEVPGGEDFEIKKAYLIGELNIKEQNISNSEQDAVDRMAKFQEIEQNESTRKGKKFDHKELPDCVDYLPYDLKASCQANKKENINIKKNLAMLLPKLTQGEKRPFQAARVRYIQTVKTLPTYGGEFFPAQRINLVKKKEKSTDVLVGVVDSKLRLLNRSNKSALESVDLREDKFLQVRRMDNRLELFVRNDTLCMIEFEAQEDVVKLYSIISNAMRFVEDKKMPLIPQEDDASEVAGEEFSYVNFSKCMKTGNIIQRILEFQHVSPSLMGDVDPTMHNFIKEYSILSEDDMYDISVELEKPK